MLLRSLLLLQLVIASTEEQNEKSELPEKFRPLKSYLLGLEEKRKAQLDFVLKAAKNVNSGKMATMAFETVTQTLSSAREQIGADFEPDILLPSEKRNLRQLEAASQLYENVAFLGDFARRLPHLLIDFWRRTGEKALIEWALLRTQESVVFEYDMWRIGHSPGSEKASLLYLPCYFLAQELDIGEQDPDYVNEFRIIREAPMNETHDEFLERHAEMKRERKAEMRAKERNERRKRGLVPPPAAKTEL